VSHDIASNGFAPVRQGVHRCFGDIAPGAIVFPPWRPNSFCAIQM
jgi:hypothetical protein